MRKSFLPATNEREILVHRREDLKTNSGWSPDRRKSVINSHTTGLVFHIETGEEEHLAALLLHIKKKVTIDQSFFVRFFIRSF